MTTVLLNLPWLVVTLSVSLFGAGWITLTKELRRSSQRSLIVLVTNLVCSLLTVWGYYAGSENAIEFGKSFRVDALGAPLLLVSAIIHLLLGLTSGRNRIARFSLVGLNLSQALLAAMITCREPWLLITLLCLEALLPILDMKSLGNRQRPYLIYMGLFMGLLGAGWALSPHQATLPATLCLVALLLRNGTFPLHSWITELFEKASQGVALSMVLSFGGVLGILRLVLPYASKESLQIAESITLLTAVYGSAMALTMREPKRFFSFLCMSQSAMVLSGLLQLSSSGLTAALCLWISTALSLAGIGVVLRALEVRFGNLSLGIHHGLYGHAPTLAVCFLLTGLASIGFPGTIGFVPLELLLTGALESGMGMAVGLVLASMLNCIAVLRVYFQLFTGKRVLSSVALPITSKERVAITLLALIVFGGGAFPQPFILSRHHIATEMLSQREKN